MLGNIPSTVSCLCSSDIILTNVTQLDIAVFVKVENYIYIRRGAEKSLAFPIYRTTERNFLRWVKEVGTTKS
jgi:hypothetical protein